MPKRSALSAYLAEIGSKGGKATGKRKARSPEHYRKMAEKSAKARKKKAAADRENEHG